VLGTAAAFLIAMSFPALVTMAYRLNPLNGGQTYSLLEVILSVGLLAGSIVVSRFVTIGSIRTVGAGLLLTGVFSLAIAMSTALGLTSDARIFLVGTALLIASLGNPIYTIANQTALMEAADASNRGSVMSTRFGLVQTAAIAGAAAGGIITAGFGRLGPFVTYGVLGVGLILLALYALAAGRSTTSAVVGAHYEEARAKSEEAPVKSGEPRVKSPVAQPQAK
jgi:MFS family permease